jgi:glycogen debranching enzyme
MGLDAEKRPIDALASNIGHCLWTGIVDEDKAGAVASLLTGDELYSGWGVRTLAKSTTGYNPISYHCGSVWPHDNAVTAAGLMRYGFVEEAHRIMEGLVDAAPFFENRLPELFAGLPREEFPFPVAYPTSCSPQAWAAASPMLFLRTLLRFEPDVRNAALHVAPAVPDWAGPLVLSGIPLMGGHVSLRAEGDTFEVLSAPEGLTVLGAPRSPTS